MVCNRCIKVVKEELTSLKYTVVSIELGEVHLREHLNDDNLEKIRQVQTSIWDGIQKISC